MIHFDTNKTLQELDGEDWGESTYDSYLVTTCHQLRKKALKDFSFEDLRIMIGQNLSLEYLVPLTLERLSNNPFAEGDYYKGDLLANVLNINEDFWRAHDDLHFQLDEIVQEVKTSFELLIPFLNNFKAPGLIRKQDEK